MMARAKSEFAMQYTVAVPALDMRRHRANVHPGVLTKNVGVDGRFAGAIRRFPGMRRLKAITFNAAGDAISTVIFFKYVALQRGNSADWLRGFVIAALDSGTTQYDVEFHYYDSNSSAWARYEIETNVGATAVIDAASAGKYLYYTRQGQTPKVIWHTGSAMTAADMGPGSFVAPAKPSVALTGSGGVLEIGEYMFAYRYHNTSRNVYSGLSAPETQAVAADDSYVTVSTSGVAEATTNIEDFNEVEIYRTISAEAAGIYGGGVFYKVGTTTITDDGATRSWTYAVGKSDTDALGDRELSQQSYYDRILDGVTAAPASGRVATYQGMTFLGGVPGTGVDDLISEVRWSPMHEYEPENFPTGNKFRLGSIDSEVLCFHEVGDYLFAVTPSVLYRFQRVGNQLLVGRAHFGRGVTGRFAAGEMDESLLLVTPTGVLLVKGSSLSMVQMGALDRLILDDGEWANALSNVSIAADSAMDATFVLNPDEDEMAILWHGTNMASRLEDCNYQYATQGSLPTETGVLRAFFINDNGLILYPDSYRQETKKTMLGSITGTVNGAVDTAGTTTVLTDSGASFDASNDLVGGYLHILDGDNAGESQVITGNTGTTITTGAFTNAHAVGDRYSVSPIPYRLRYWPLTMKADGGTPRALFRRWKVKSMAVAVTGLDLDDDSDNDFWDVGIYRRAEASLDADRKTTIALSENPADSYAKLQVDGLLLEPALEQMASNTEFEIVAVLVSATPTESKEVE